ncbi:hypothetical protein GPA10_04125 [Streptomyces sp. p1417]|uniref:Uncharacterized protein n=1 Tax=Streptomyces typhae TaxID=2681492 RepID=A0A6L6WS29_9ACTN|nr:hypothetical protein [Streptomyces typhae]MVO83974.1 hypothetical protein [Streptomyces typhae]
MHVAGQESTPSIRREYHAEAVGTGPVDGQQVRVVLGTLETPYLGIMMRWVGTQAHRIADALDPEPCAPWLADAPDALVMLHLPAWAPDVPTELRTWCADGGSRQAARDRLRAGWPFTLAAADHSGTYCVWVVPVDVPVDVLAGQLGDEPRIPTAACAGRSS